MSFLLVHAKLNLTELDADSIVIGLSMFRCFGQFVVSTRYYSAVTVRVIKISSVPSPILGPFLVGPDSKNRPIFVPTLAAHCTIEWVRICQLKSGSKEPSIHRP